MFTIIHNGLRALRRTVLVILSISAALHAICIQCEVGDSMESDVEFTRLLLLVDRVIGMVANDEITDAAAEILIQAVAGK